MSKKMLIESDPHQTRIAILESDRLAEIFVEPREQRTLVGNIFVGRVHRVLPGMQAAFVNIGLERDAFLYVSDVVQFTDETESDPLAERPDEALLDQEPQDEPSIDELLRVGQRVIVQVTKDALPNKGARVTTQVTLPSRHLVLLPTVRHLGVSRRIQEPETRQRLKEMLGELPGPGGWIVRTAGEGLDAEACQEEAAFLVSLWARISESAAKVEPPTLVHRDTSLARRVVRDVLSDEFNVLWVDGEETYQDVVEFLDMIQPELVGRVRLNQSDDTLFDRFDVETAIESALHNKVWLKSGGYLVINQTEALVAIDVNTGRYVGQENLESTVLATNLEAVAEAVRQIRLRDLSGIIILDLIDMTEKAHQEQVFEALERELQRDRSRNKVLNISEFGLVELTRKRSHANLERLLTRPCPYCRGTGRIKTLSAICLNIRREVLRARRRGTRSEVLVRVHPEVATALQTHERPILDELSTSLGREVLLQSDDELHHERFDISEV